MALQSAHCAWPVWTFNTSAGFRIMAIFRDFNFEESREFLVIGDGSVHDEASELVRFSGTDLPSNVTSVSNAAWMKFEYRVDRCCRTPVLNITVTAIEMTGIYTMHPKLLLFLD